MWRHQGVTTGKRSDDFEVFAHPQRGAKKLPPMSLDNNTLKSTHVDVASVGHLVAKALKTEGVWILISALAGKLSLKISFLSSRNAFRANHPTVDVLGRAGKQPWKLARQYLLGL